MLTMVRLLLLSLSISAGLVAKDAPVPKGFVEPSCLKATEGGALFIQVENGTKCIVFGANSEPSASTDKAV
jgi:hypothetical protein